VAEPTTVPAPFAPIRPGAGQPDWYGLRPVEQERKVHERGTGLPFAAAGRRAGDTAGSADHADVVAGVRADLDRVLDPALRPLGRYAVVGYPRGRNIGEYLMWLGTAEHLRRRGIRPVYICDRTGYARHELAARLGDGGTILLAGGGNLGDLWPHEQRFREQVLEDFPGARIVQLPQSMHFGRDENLERAQKVFAAHPDFTLLLRDPVSYEAARAAFPSRTVLSPDIAFGMPPLPAGGGRPHAIVWLARDDHESRHPPGALPAEVHRWDWAAGHGRPFAWALVRRLGTALAGDGLALRPPGAAGAGHAVVGVAARRLARGHLVRGMAHLASARVVVTDRIHGHILSLLLGRPQVVLDNGDGKVHSLVLGWTGASPLVHLATSAEEALEKATALAA
jgi:exopolysaccharide biosynthesis predicted pyruvyltransferase EpsI